MKLRFINLILTTITSAVCLGLLIYVGYAWYVNSQKVTAENITFTSKEGTDIGYEVTVLGSDGKVISAPLLPGEISMLSIEITDSSEKSLHISMTPKMSYKEVYEMENNLPKATVATEGSTQIRYAKSVVNDPSGESSLEKYTDLYPFYMLDSYYIYDSTKQIGEMSKKYGLTDQEKQEIFSSFYNQSTYNLINKIKFYVSDTLYKSDQYYDELITKIGGENNIFSNLTSGMEFDMNLTLDESNYKAKKYIYLYMDPTDEIFIYNGETSKLNNICFIGQNPYFYQMIKFDVLSTEG